MKIKTSELTGVALDWAVAKALGGTIRTENGVFLNQGDGYEYFTPSTDWSQGGPILEWERIGTTPWSVTRLPDGTLGWSALGANMPSRQTRHGPTKLVAGLRYFVASWLGDEVDVPEELLA